MSEYPSNYRYTKHHEWVSVEGDIATIGITDYAQGELDAITFIELPAVGDTCEVDDVIGTIEAVKVAEDLYAPVGGEVVEANAALVDPDDPTKIEDPDNIDVVHKSPFGDGWFIKVKVADPADFDALMDKDAYLAMVGE